MKNFDDLFRGTILIIAPHMDDEVLACGGLISKLPDKMRLHLIYATDGMRSPSPIIAGVDTISADLGEVRIKESVAAMKLLGVSKDNLHFFRLPEAQLQKNRHRLKERLCQAIADINPELILIPFRYDKHPDHVSINQSVMEGYQEGIFKSVILEYFVYYRWRLLPKGDIRKYIKAKYLFELDIKDVAGLKRKALNCFISQTTIFYPWQTRPILTGSLLDEECRYEEIFLRYDPAYPGTKIFTKYVPWILLVHRTEPVLKKWKYISGAIIKRMIRANA